MSAVRIGSVARVATVNDRRGLPPLRERWKRRQLPTRIHFLARMNKLKFGAPRWG